MIKKIIYTISIITILSLFLVNSVFAKTTSKETIRVTPAFISTTSLPGKNISENLSIYNETRKPLSININPTNVDYKRGKIYYNSSESITNILSWISISSGNRNFTVSPQSTVNIPVTINIPTKSAFGSYNGAIIVSNVTKGISNQSKVVGSIVVNIFLNLRGKNKGYSLLKVTPNNPNFFEFNTPFKFNYSVLNNGPYNNAFISSLSIHSIFYNKNLKSKLTNILVKQKRVENFNINNIPWGLYSINLNIKNIGNNLNTNKSFYILYLPYYIYIILTILIIAIILILFKRKSKIKYT